MFIISALFIYLFLSVFFLFSRLVCGVSSGFSINKSLLLENLNEESIISQMHVHDFVMSSGGIKKVEINDKMILAVKGSRTRWNVALEEKRKKIAESEKISLSRKRQREKIRLKIEKTKYVQNSCF